MLLSSPVTEKMTGNCSNAVSFMTITDQLIFHKNDINGLDCKDLKPPSILRRHFTIHSYSQHSHSCGSILSEQVAIIYKLKENGPAKHEGRGDN